MKLSDYSKWVKNEAKESKIFTALNVIGVWISVYVLILFLALALGVEETTINRITEEVDLFTLEVDPQNDKQGLLFTDFAQFETDERVKQIVPVLTEFLELGVPGYEQTAPIYTENYFIDDYGQSDTRASSLSFIQGKTLNRTDFSGIIVSKDTFDQLAAIKPELELSNYNNEIFQIIVDRYNASNEKESITFDVSIVGIAETTSFNGVLVYLSPSLAYRVDDWLNYRPNQESNYRMREYERFDFVANDLDDLESLRDQFREQGYPTSSVLDRIDNVRRVLLVVRVVFFFIFGIAILIAGFNIVITLTSYVLKRKQEIGILKSIGATDWQIQNIFILHAIYLSVLGSVLGVIGSYLTIQIIRFILSFVDSLAGIELFRFDIMYALLIIISSILLSVLASLAPARRAASITPIDTIREA